MSLKIIWTRAQISVMDDIFTSEQLSWLPEAQLRSRSKQERALIS